MQEFIEAVEPLALALGGEIVPAADLENGDLPLRFEGSVVAGFRATGLQGALDRLIDQVERELGRSIISLDRAGKQDVVTCACSPTLPVRPC